MPKLSKCSHDKSKKCSYSPTLSQNIYIHVFKRYLFSSCLFNKFVVEPCEILNMNMLVCKIWVFLSLLYNKLYVYNFNVIYTRIHSKGITESCGISERGRLLLVELGWWGKFRWILREGSTKAGLWRIDNLH